MVSPENLESACESSDRSLLRRVERGESDAAVALYLRYARRLHALAQRQTGADLASRFDPEDIVQSVFRTFFRRASTGLYDIPEGDELWKLFLVVALNKIRKKGAHHRAAKRDVRATSSIGEGERASAVADARDDEALHVLRMTIDDELRELSEAEALVVKLRIAGHGVKEIADMTGRAKRTVERILQRFREQLDRVIEREQLDAGS